MGKGGEEPVAGCEAVFFRRGGGGGDLDVPAGGFEVGTLKGGRLVLVFLFGVMVEGERCFFLLTVTKWNNV